MDEPLVRLAEVVSEQGMRLVLAAVALAVLGISVVPAPFDTAFVASATAFVALAAIAQAVMSMRRAHNRAAIVDIAVLSHKDPTPCFITTLDGALHYANPSARQRFTPRGGDALSTTLSDFFANPVAVLRRLQEKALAIGNAQEDVITPNGHMRLTVVAADDTALLWRLEEVVKERRSGHSDSTFCLPVIVAAQSGVILFMNEAMQDLAGGNPSHLDRLFHDLPLRNDEIHGVAGAKGMISCRVSVVDTSDGNREIYLLPISQTANKESPSDQDPGLEELPVGLLQLSKTGTILTANRLARGLISVDDEDVIGAELTDRLEGLGRPVGDWLEDALNGRGLGRPEVLRVCGPDTEAYLQVTLDRVKGQGDVRLVAVLSDATKLKTLEAQFVQSQKMQAIGQLAGGVAHDFNNLLTAISGHCDLMMLRHEQSDPDYADLVQIHQNANRAASLVGQLLAFSRKQTLQPQVIDLRDTLSDLTHLLNRLVGERVTLTLNHEPGLPTIRADRRQLEQVFMNLVVNARDAMPAGGEIKVETMERVLLEEYRRDRAKIPPGRYVIVKVEDHGDGIAPDKLTKIFEPFFTTKRTGEGTGLGLSTAYGIVKQSGGFIFADSVVAAGTVFTIYFPVYDRVADEVSSSDEVADVVSVSVAKVPERFSGQGAGHSASLAVVQDPQDQVEDDVQKGDLETAKASLLKSSSSDLGMWTAEFLDNASGDVEAQEESAAKDNADTPSPSRTASPLTTEEATPGEAVVLLVEDEAPVRAFASRALRMRGYTVIEAECAEEALSILEDTALKIDLFVTDVIMPGMDGPTWVRKALEVRPDVKVVFVSGYAEDSFGEEQARIPNSVFLPKPFSLSELTATVQDQLG